jgi:hypothetical protein
MQFVRGASFDKKEFKRNLAGSGSYPPVYGIRVSRAREKDVQHFRPHFASSHICTDRPALGLLISLPSSSRKYLIQFPS